MSEENLTNIQIIVFEDEDGLDIEMELIDEFKHNNNNYVALRPSPDSLDFDSEEDNISFFRVFNDEETNEEMFDLVEDASTLSQLADLLEDRLLSTQ